MLEKEKINEFVRSGNFEVQMLMGVPLAKIKATPGPLHDTTWNDEEDFSRIVQRASKHMLSLNPHPSSASTSVVSVQGETVLVGLARTPDLQPDLLSTAGSTQNKKILREVAQLEAACAKSAIEAANKIIAECKEKGIPNYLAFKEILDTSPSPALTLDCLRSKEDFEVFINEVPVRVAAAKDVPETFDAGTTLSVCAEVTGGVDRHNLIAEVKFTGFAPSTPLTKTLKHTANARMVLGSDIYASFFLISQLTKIPVECEIAASVHRSGERIAGATLMRIKNMEQLGRSIASIPEQLSLDI